MHMITAILAALVALLLSVHTGSLRVLGLSRPERNVRLGIVLVMITLAVGFAQRSAISAPYEWIHLLVLAALSFCAANYAVLIFRPKKPIRRG